MRLRLAEIVEITRGRLVDGQAEAEMASYHTDSRLAVPGGLFVALPGAAMDGHAFVADAAARGAAAVLVERPQPVAVAQVVVADTWRALYDLAASVLARVSPLVVGVTGSNGKTSTKEMTAAVLAARHRVHSTTGNLNTETGLPLTVLQLEPAHTAVVLEMGMRAPGEIARLAALARPRVGVVTGIGSVHAEYFADGRAGIARAKGELVEALPPDGLAVLNADDDYFEVLAALSPAPVLGFGLEAGDLRGSGYSRLPDGGTVFTVQAGGETEGAPARSLAQVRLSLGGRHQVRNALAALAVGRFAGVPIEMGAARLAGVRVAHRLEELPQPAGWTLIDDAYNASPESMLASFESIAERRPPGRLLALLGEMRELGPLAEEAHRRVGLEAARRFDQVAVLDGVWGRVLAHAAGAELLPDLDAAESWVRAAARPGDAVLVKASHGVALYEVVSRLRQVEAP